MDDKTPTFDVKITPQNLALGAKENIKSQGLGIEDFRTRHRYCELLQQYLQRLHKRKSAEKEEDEDGDKKSKKSS